jgi:predicted DNA-binding protein
MNKTPEKRSGRIKTGKVTLQIRLRPNTRERLEQLARTDLRTMSEIVEEALLIYLDKKTR